MRSSFQICGLPSICSRFWISVLFTLKYWYSCSCRPVEPADPFERLLGVAREAQLVAVLVGADDLPVGEGAEVLQRRAVLNERARDIRDGHARQVPVKLGAGDVGPEILELLADEEGIAGRVDAERRAGARGRAQRVVPRD